MLTHPVPADPEIAAATFESHLKQFWDNERYSKRGWGLIRLDALHVVVAMPATRPTGDKDWYFVKLGATYYDVAPPSVLFVDPADWSPAREGMRWFPVISPNPPWFTLHNAYGFPDGTSRQLVCFTFTAEYYMVGHSPPEASVWQQGRHTVAATLNRLAEVLSPPYYQRPSA